MPTTEVPFSRFNLPGLNLPLNFRPHPANHKYNAKSVSYTQIPAKGEGQDLFRTALNGIDVNGDGGYVA
jgi:hypothetical protein